MKGIFLGLGSNIGDRKKFLQKAIVLLEKQNIQVLQKSSVYETQPVGALPQPDFLNMVIQISTDLSPEDLLTICLDIEQKLGRIRDTRFGPRTIDLDILLYGDRILRSNFLAIPHPHMLERKFVLIPLAEIAPDFFHPVLQKPIREFLNLCPDPSRVIIFS